MWWWPTANCCPSVNVHGSLLPQYRGAAPIQWTVLNGDKVAGVTTMFMAEGMDTGDMLLKAETPVGEEETSGQLFDRLKDLGADLLLETLQGLEAGTLTSVPQDEAQATRAPMLSKELSQVDWTKSAQQVHDLIRGLNPWPSAVSYLDGRKLKLHASRVREGSGEPGKPFAQDGALWVYCGQGADRDPNRKRQAHGRQKLLAGSSAARGFPLWRTGKRMIQGEAALCLKAGRSPMAGNGTWWWNGRTLCGLSDVGQRPAEPPTRAR